MEKTYKYRLYPNKAQERLIIKTFGCSRFIYNYFLNERNQESLKTGKSIHFFEMSKRLTVLKQTYEWLSEVDKWTLQNALRNLDRNFESFFNKTSGRPTFKSRKDNHQSFRTTFTNKNIELIKGKVKLPKLSWMKIKGGRYPTSGRLLNATVKRNPSGRYYIYICYTDVKVTPIKKTRKKVGIDFGIKDFIITSDGKHFQGTHFLKKSLQRVKFLQKAVTRKTIGSSNREKARRRFAKAYEKIVNQRKDFLDKLSLNLIRDYDVICLENIKVQKLLVKAPGHVIPQSISDLSWYTFTEMLKYKANWYGKTVVKIDTYFPSSQLCSKCGHKSSITKDLNIREWTCPECKTKHDRDINAATNILREGIRLLKS